MEKKKDGKWQIIRGICILATILIHCRSYTQFDASLNSWFYFFYRNLINFPVAIFMFMSGYFTNTHKILVGGVHKNITRVGFRDFSFHI